MIPKVPGQWVDFNIGDFGALVDDDFSLNTITIPLVIDDNGMLSSTWKYSFNDAAALDNTNSVLSQGVDEYRNFERNSVFVRMMHISIKVNFLYLCNTGWMKSPIVFRLWKDMAVGNNDIDLPVFQYIGAGSSHDPIYGTTLNANKQMHRYGGRIPAPELLLEDPVDLKSLHKIDPSHVLPGGVGNADPYSRGWKLVKKFQLKAPAQFLANGLSVQKSAQDFILHFKFKLGRIKFDSLKTDTAGIAKRQQNNRLFLTINWANGNAMGATDVNPLLYHGSGRLYYNSE